MSKRASQQKPQSIHTVNPPARVLLVTADMGEGHNAACRAIEEAIHRTWPTCETTQVDAIRLMGRWVSWLIRSVYRFEITKAPWIYQFFYDALWRFRWLAAFEKWFCGTWSGRGIRRVIRRFRPDMVISTYPIGTAALGALRRTGKLPVTAGAYVMDFDAHPFWVAKPLDMHLLMHEISIPPLRAMGVQGEILVAAPPIRSAFRPMDRGGCRQLLGLRRDAMIPLLSGGAWGVGTFEQATAALLALGEGVQVVVLCGRNERLRADLRSLGLPRERLLPLGFIDYMPELMGACDVVISNAGGITCLEAFASGRPLVLFDPIAGHGRASAQLIEKAGLGLLCSGPEELARVVSRLSGNDLAATRMRKAEFELMAGKRIEQDLKRLAETPPGASRSPLPRRLIKSGVAAALLPLLFVQLSFVAGTRLAHAARGGGENARTVSVALAGDLTTSTLQAAELAAARAGIPLTFFIQGQDAAADAPALRRLLRAGDEVESGTWQAWRDGSFEIGDVSAEFNRSLSAMREAIGTTPRYVAEPGGRFSLLAVIMLAHSHVRRVVFGQRIAVGDEAPAVPAIGASRIVELLVLPQATPSSVAAVITEIAHTIQGESLRAETVAQIDGRTSTAWATAGGSCSAWRWRAPSWRPCLLLANEATP